MASRISCTSSCAVLPSGVYSRYSEMAVERRMLRDWRVSWEEAFALPLLLALNNCGGGDMTEIDVMASIRARRPEAVGRTMTSVVSVLPGHVNKPQPQPHSCGAEDTSRATGAEEEDGIGVSVEDAATVAGDEFCAARPTGA